MKNLITKIACAAALVVPVMASAASYVASGDTDTMNIDIVGTGLFNAKVDATWSDLQFTNDRRVVEKDATAIGWSLTSSGLPTVTGSFTDATGTLSGAGPIKLSNLIGGVHYVLTLTGNWAAGNSPSGYDRKNGDVNLLDGDRIDGRREANTFSYVAAVPEPETYAMMLAGLGLMMTIARRRRRNS